MKFIKKTNWREVFQNWKDAEANNPEWIYCATKIKGWPNWESWRSFTATQLNLQNRSWNLYEFEDHLNEISEMLIGPYSGWQKRIKNKNLSTFYDLANIKKEYKYFKNNEKIVSILKSSFFSSNFIGIIREDINKIVCIEGHHRAMAIAIARKDNTKINFKKPINITLAKIPKEEVCLIDKTLKRGTEKGI